MAFASGTFSLVSGNPVVTGTTISSTVNNNTLSDIATNGLSLCLLKDGTQTVTANIPMAAFKFTGLGAGSAANDSVRVAQLQTGIGIVLTTIAGTNTITAVANPVISAYAANQLFVFIPAATNTGATTINIDGLGAKNIFSLYAACLGGELVANVPAQILYDGTQFNIVGSGAMFAPLAVAKNILINPDGRILQRGSASTADAAYCFDQWKALSQTGNITPSQLTDAANGTPYMMRLTQIQAGAQRMGTGQLIEAANCKVLRGRAVTLSVKHKISSNGNIRLAILEWTGTADSPGPDPVNDWTSSTYTAGNFFSATTLTVTGVSSAIASTSSLATATLTATIGSSVNNLWVMAWTEGTAAQNVTLDVAFQLELGSRNTEFEYRSMEEELALCQRYFYQGGFANNDVITTLQAISTTVAYGKMMDLPVVMRITPTVSKSDVSHFGLSKADGTDAGALSVWTPYCAGNRTSVVATDYTTSANLVAGNSTTLTARSASAYIRATAEL